MARLSKDFLDEDSGMRSNRLSYIDGFRFGFGLFIAWLIGSLVVLVLGVIIASIFHIH